MKTDRNVGDLVLWFDSKGKKTYARIVISDDDRSQAYLYADPLQIPVDVPIYVVEWQGFKAELKTVRQFVFTTPALTHQELA